MAQNYFITKVRVSLVEVCTITQLLFLLGLKKIIREKNIKHNWNRRQILFSYLKGVFLIFNEKMCRCRSNRVKIGLLDSLEYSKRAEYQRFYFGNMCFILKWFIIKTERPNSVGSYLLTLRIKISQREMVQWG